MTFSSVMGKKKAARSHEYIRSLQEIKDDANIKLRHEVSNAINEVGKMNDDKIRVKLFILGKPSSI